MDEATECLFELLLLVLLTVIDSLAAYLGILGLLYSRLSNYMILTLLEQTLSRVETQATDLAFLSLLVVIAGGCFIVFFDGLGLVIA